MSVAKGLLSVGAVDSRRALNALTAVKNGDFSVRLPVDWTDVNGKIADTFNEVVSQNERSTKELERESRVVGRQAIQLVQNTADLRALLMDIMMPEMDGYQTMREIRSDPRFQLLPILALTAKAMKGDQEKCLAAGASDYIAKPVNTDQLFSLLRVWLHR